MVVLHSLNLCIFIYFYYCYLCRRSYVWAEFVFFVDLSVSRVTQKYGWIFVKVGGQRTRNDWFLW